MRDRLPARPSVGSLTVRDVVEAGAVHVDLVDVRIVVEGDLGSVRRPVKAAPDENRRHCSHIGPVGVHDVDLVLPEVRVARERDGGSVGGPGRHCVPPLIVGEPRQFEGIQIQQPDLR